MRIISIVAGALSKPFSRVLNDWSSGFWRLVLFGLVGAICSISWSTANPGSAEGALIKLRQPVDGLEEFDTRNHSHNELEHLATKLARDYPSEHENVKKIHHAIRNNDFHNAPTLTAGENPPSTPPSNHLTKPNPNTRSTQHDRQRIP